MTTDILESPVDRIEAAAQAIEENSEVVEDGGDPVISEQKEEVEESTSDEPKGETSEASEDAPKEKVEKKASEPEKKVDEPEKKSDEPEKKSDEPEHWRWQQLRKREKQLQEYESRMEARIREIEDRASKYSRYEQLMREDPEKFVSELGDPDELYERWTERRLNGGKPGEQEAWNEIQSLKKMLRDKEVEEQRRQEQYQQYQQQQQVENHIQGYVKESDRVEAEPELSSRFPALSVTHPARRRAMVDHAVRWAIHNAPDTPFEHILKVLDKNLAEEYAEVDSRRSRVTGTQENAPEAQGAGKPAAKRKTVTNIDEAATSVNFKPLTQDERLAAAAREIPDFSLKG